MPMTSSGSLRTRAASETRSSEALPRVGGFAALEVAEEEAAKMEEEGGLAPPLVRGGAADEDEELALAPAPAADEAEAPADSALTLKAAARRARSAACSAALRLAKARSARRRRSRRVGFPRDAPLTARSDGSAVHS